MKQVLRKSPEACRLVGTGRQALALAVAGLAVVAWELIPAA